MTVLDDSPPASVGGRYTIGELIGRGGAADVYRARDELLGRDVAVKMFVTGGDSALDAAVDGEHPDGAPDGAPGGDSGADEAAEVRHRREVLTLAGLSHPGLVTVYDVGAEDGRAYFVMQLIEGDTLARRIRAGALPVSDVVALGAALGDALSYVHRRGVVHRDVKPGNVLLDTDGRAHLSDFGIAAVSDAAPVTAAGMVIGTASYLSPEQVRGEAVGAGVDVYALGLVLLESATGRREYPGNALEAAVARLHRRPVIPPGLPAGLSALLDAMTADDPAARPTAEEVVGALRAISREVGMDAATVLSPVLMGAPTVAAGPIDGPTVLSPAAAPVVPSPVPRAPQPAAAPYTAPTPGGSTTPPAPGAPPARRRRLLAGAVAAATTLLLAGSAVAAYTMIGQEGPVPATSQVAPAPALPLPSSSEAAPTSSADVDEQATATRAPRSRTTPVPTRARTAVPESPEPTAAPEPSSPRAPVSPPRGPSSPSEPSEQPSESSGPSEPSNPSGQPSPSGELRSGIVPGAAARP